MTLASDYVDRATVDTGLAPYGVRELAEIAVTGVADHAPRLEAVERGTLEAHSELARFAKQIADRAAAQASAKSGRRALAATLAGAVTTAVATNATAFVKSLAALLGDGGGQIIGAAMLLTLVAGLIVRAWDARRARLTRRADGGTIAG